MGMNTMGLGPEPDAAVSPVLRRKRPLLLLIAPALVACGGGSGGGIILPSPPPQTPLGTPFQAQSYTLNPGATAQPPVQRTPAPAPPQPTLALNAAGLADCPSHGGPAGTTGLSGLGASVDEFAVVHAPQHADAASVYGTAGGPSFTISCSAHGAVSFVEERLPVAVPADHLKTVGWGPFAAVAPSDAVQIADQPGTQAYGHECELVTYRSALLAKDPAADDPSGSFVLGLQSPLSANGWDPSQVDDLIFDASGGGNGC